MTREEFLVKWLEQIKESEREEFKEELDELLEEERHKVYKFG